jgi:hypothetical protein
MSEPHDIDGVLVQWGDRLFYPGNRIVKSRPPPKLSALAARQRAAAIRARIEATVVRRVPQVMVKVTGGGRGAGAHVACTSSGFLLTALLRERSGVSVASAFGCSRCVLRRSR